MIYKMAYRDSIRDIVKGVFWHYYHRQSKYQDYCRQMGYYRRGPHPPRMQLLPQGLPNGHE